MAIRSKHLSPMKLLFLYIPHKYVEFNVPSGVRSTSYPQEDLRFSAFWWTRREENSLWKYRNVSPAELRDKSLNSTILYLLFSDNSPRCCDIVSDLVVPKTFEMAYYIYNEKFHLHIRWLIVWIAPNFNYIVVDWYFNNSQLAIEP